MRSLFSTLITIAWFYIWLYVDGCTGFTRESVGGSSIAAATNTTTALEHIQWHQQQNKCGGKYRLLICSTTLVQDTCTHTHNIARRLIDDNQHFAVNFGKERGGDHRSNRYMCVNIHKHTNPIDRDYL